MLRVVDLFAGAGGLSLGFEWAGMDVTLAIEMDAWATDTYAVNLPKATLLQRDITTISDTEISALAQGPIDIVIGGPPCQGFSHSNTTNKDPRDPRNSLFEEFIRFLKVLQPRACLIENVKGLLTSKTVSGKPVLDVIREELLAAGYVSDAKVLNAVDYGVPQQRERLFIVGWRGDELPGSPWPLPSHLRGLTDTQGELFGSANPRKVVTLWEAISDLPQVTWEDCGTNLMYRTPPANPYQQLMRQLAPSKLHNFEPMRHTRRIIERFATIGFGQSEATIAEHLRPRRRTRISDEQSGGGYGQNSRRQRPDRPCNTVVASSHTNYIHPFLNRNFTVRELARVQSFPDWFEFRGKRAVLSKKLCERKGLLDDMHLDQMGQVGNAVPPLLAKALAESLTSLLRVKSSSREVA